MPLCHRLTKKSSAVFDSLFEDDGKQRKRSDSKSGPILSGLAYCISSCSMILLNKAVLSGYNFTAGISLMLYQVNMGSE
jgi:GDP-mannose transporter